MKRQIKKQLLIALLSVLLPVLALSCVYLYFRTMYTKESAAFVDKTVPVISQNWNVIILSDYLTSDYKKRIDWAEMNKLFMDKKTAVGEIQSYLGARGYSNIRLDTKGIIIGAEYKADVEGEKAKGRFNLLLQRQQGNWYIDNLSLDVIQK